MYIDKLDDKFNKYNNSYSTIKMKIVDVNSNTYINSSKEINDKNLQFKIGDIVRISKFKNIFAKTYFPNWGSFLEYKNWKYCVISVLLCYYVISDLKCQEIYGTFYEKELQKTNKKEFRVEK